MNRKVEISLERKEYLYKIKKEKYLVLLTQGLMLFAFLAFWEISTQIGLQDPFLVSSPSRIIDTFSSMLGSSLVHHISVTFIETIIGFALGVIFGTLIAIILWLSPFLSKVMAPYLVILNSLPKIALGPIIIIWVGAGESAIIVMALLISIVVTILEMLNGFLNTDKDMILMAKTLGANKIQILTKIVIPANIETLFSSLKINLGLSLVGVIAGEFLVSKAGLGYLIVYGGQVFKLDLVMMSVIILLCMTSFLYKIILIIEKRVKKITH